MCTAYNALAAERISRKIMVPAEKGQCPHELYLFGSLHGSKL